MYSAPDNKRVNLTVRPVTRLAARQVTRSSKGRAQGARPSRPAGYARRYAHVMARDVMLLLLATVALVTIFPNTVLAVSEHSPHHAARQTATVRDYQPVPGDFILICTIYENDPPGATPPIPQVPITFDPRFVVGARVENVLSGPSPWKKGTVLRFLIHSPTLMFVGVNPDGKRYEMTFSTNTTFDKATGSATMNYVIKALRLQDVTH
jgi:hypothetical protein